MASKVEVLLTASPLPSNWTQPKEEALDLGAFRQLNVAFEVLTTGSGGTDEKLYHEHAAINDDGAYTRLAGIEAVVSNDGLVGVTAKSVDGFLRYVRARTDSLTGTPGIAGVRIVAKE